MFPEGKNHVLYKGNVMKDQTVWADSKGSPRSKEVSDEGWNVCEDLQRQWTFRRAEFRRARRARGYSKLAPGYLHQQQLSVVYLYFAADCTIALVKCPFFPLLSLPLKLVSVMINICVYLTGRHVQMWPNIIVGVSVIVFF